MYSTPQMHQETPPGVAKPFPSLWSMALSTLKIWRGGWGIFTFINLCIVVLGTVTLFIIHSIMPWIKTYFTAKKSFDPALIASYYPDIATLVQDLATVAGVLFIFTLCIVLSQIMTIHAMNPEMRAKGPKHLFLFSLKLIPKYSLTLALVSLMIAGGASLMLIPGILILPLAIVAVFVAALEGSYGVKAITQSTLYTKGYLIEALWRSIVILIIINAVSFILPFLASLPVYPFTLIDFSDHTIKILGFIAGTIYTCVSLMLSLIMPSLLMIFYFLIYSHMKDNPADTKPISTKLLIVFAIIGIIVIIGAFILEGTGI